MDSVKIKKVFPTGLASLARLSLRWLALLFIFQASPANALKGKLVINGFEVPTEWTVAYEKLAKAHPSHDLCPPKDEAYQIEIMAYYILPYQEAIRRGLDVSDAKKKSYETQFNKEDLPSYALDKHLRYLRDRRGGYAALLSERITSEEVVAEYEKRVKNNDRRVVNVQLFRSEVYKFLKRELAEAIVKSATAGEDYHAVAVELIGKEYIEEDFTPYSDSTSWTSGGEFTSITPTDSKYAVGDILLEPVGVGYFNVLITKEVKIEPIINLAEKYPWQWFPVKENIASELARERDQAIYRTLREQADIQFNGKKVGLPDFDEIFKHGKYRKGSMLSRCLVLSL